MIEFFLQRRVITNLITVFIVIVGGYQFFTVRREAFPEISFDFVSITTPYPGGSPEEVERLVTNVIEKELRTVDGIDRVQSFSIENRSLIIIRLNEDLSSREKIKVVNDVQQAVNRVQDLPDEAEKSIVEEMTSDRPLITLSVAGGTDEARDAFAEELSDVIEEIKGVSRVDQVGDRPREIRVEADREKLAQARIALAEIAATIRSQNLNLSAGTIEMGPQELWVRVVGSAKGAADIGSIILRGNDERSYVRVRDVAVVTERFAEERVITKANGLPSINLSVRKVKSGDTIELADEVRKVKEEFEDGAKKKNLTLVLSDDVSFFIKRRLRVMTSNLLQGGFLILLALFIFLDWRLALVAAWGVPLSFATAFMVAVPLGFTINLMSLLALIIVLGMLDDDSVVVAENIYRHMEMGKPTLRAAVDGAKEVVVPVTGAILVSCCGFLPFAMVSGIMGKFLLMIPVVIIITFLASAFEAFFVLPAHVVELMPLGKPVEESSEGRWYTYVIDTYRKTLRWMLSHRVKFFLLLFVFIGLTVLFAMTRLKFVLFPTGLVDQFFIELNMPEGTGLTETGRVFEKIEQEIMKLTPEELEAVTTTIGMKGFDQTSRIGTHYAQARVFLTPEEKRKRKTKVLIEDLRKRVEAIAGGNKVVFQELQPGPPVGRAIDLRVRGREETVIRDIVGRIKKELDSMKGVTDVQDSYEGGKEEIRVVLDDREAGFAGLDVARVAQNILFAIDGGEASKIRRPTEEVKVKVRLRPDQRSNPEELMKLYIPNPQGRLVRLGEVAELKKEKGLPFIEHYNYRPAIQVTAAVDKAVITPREANLAVAKKFKNISKEYPGYELIAGGEEEETAKSMKSLFRAFGVAILLDYVVLASIFASYLQPFIIILLTVPIGLLGVVYALLLHGQPASFMALLGVVAMTGVVINNAIVLVNFINQRRKEGVPVKEAVVEAGAVRLRPIWASSITTLLGLFPTAYGWGGKEPFVAPMALSLAWGLTIAMPMTLVLIPMAYVLLDDFTRRMARVLEPLKKRIFGRITHMTHKQN